MRNVDKTLRSFDLWIALGLLLGLIGYVAWYSWKDGFAPYQFLFLIFVLSPAFIFFIFNIVSANDLRNRGKHRWLYFYLLITRQSKRLTLEKLKDSIVNFKHLHPKWRDDEDIVHLAVCQDLSNLAWCSERFCEDLEFVVEMYHRHGFEIKLTSIRDVYFAFLCRQGATHQTNRFFFGTSIVKYFKRPDFEFEAERSFAESLFGSCTKDSSWCVERDDEQSLARLKEAFPEFSEDSYRRAIGIVEYLNRPPSPNWIW